MHRITTGSEWGSDPSEEVASRARGVRTSRADREAGPSRTAPPPREAQPPRPRRCPLAGGTSSAHCMLALFGIKENKNNSFSFCRRVFLPGGLLFSSSESLLVGPGPRTGIFSPEAGARPPDETAG